MNMVVQGEKAQATYSGDKNVSALISDITEFDYNKPKSIQQISDFRKLLH